MTGMPSAVRAAIAYHCQPCSQPAASHPRVVRRGSFGRQQGPQLRRQCKSRRRRRRRRLDAAGRSGTCCSRHGTGVIVFQHVFDVGGACCSRRGGTVIRSQHVFDAVVVVVTDHVQIEVSRGISSGRVLVQPCGEHAVFSLERGAISVVDRGFEHGARLLDGHVLDDGLEHAFQPANGASKSFDIVDIVVVVVVRIARREAAARNAMRVRASRLEQRRKHAARVCRKRPTFHGQQQYVVM